MPVRMLLVRGLCGNAERYDRNDPASHIAQIVHAVRNDRNKTEKCAENNFRRRK